jgi:hypothetical protein
VTCAFRLSTVGREVLDGNGLGVSEGSKVSVKSTTTVGEAVSMIASVEGTNAVWVGMCVPTEVGETGVTEVNVQASKPRMHKVEAKSLPLISQSILLGIVYAKLPSLHDLS